MTDQIKFNQAEIDRLTRLVDYGFGTEFYYDARDLTPLAQSWPVMVQAKATADSLQAKMLALDLLDRIAPENLSNAVLKSFNHPMAGFTYWKFTREGFEKAKKILG